MPPARPSFAALALFVVLLGGAPALGGDFHGPDASRHVPPDRLVDFVHVAAKITVDPAAGTVSGSVSHRFKAVGVPRNRVLIHAAPALTISAVTDAKGAPLKFQRDGDVLAIILPTPVGLKAEATVEVRYSGSPVDGMHFVTADVDGERVPEVWTQGETSFTRGWLPVWDYPNDRFTSDVTVTVPSAYRVIGNGALVSETVDGEQRTVRWAMKRPHVAYLLSLCIGRFQIWREKLAAPALFVGYTEDKSMVERLRAPTDFSLKHLASLTGRPYPYSKYSQTLASHYPIGGMENVTATTLARELAAHDESVALGYEPAGLVVHEAAHQWFGDLVTCRDWAHIWLNEGFATYFTSLVFRRESGTTRAQESLFGMRRWYLGETAKYKRALVTYRFDRPGSMFDAHTYAKGAWVLHMLRAELGEPLFLAGVARYLAAGVAAGGLVDTHDLQRAMEAASGRSLGAFFDQWVRSAGHPVLDVRVRDDAAAGKVRVRVVQKQPQLFDFPLSIRVTGSGAQSETHRVHIREKTQTVILPRAARPTRVEVDPDGDLLAEMKLDVPRKLLRAQVEGGSGAWSRTAAAAALGAGKRDAQDVKTLAYVVGSDRQPRMVRIAAAKALGAIADKAACLALRTSMHVARPTPADAARVRAAVAKALGACKGSVVDVLRGPATKDPSVHVRSAALKAIGTSAGAKAPKQLLAKALRLQSWRGLLAKGAAAGLASIKASWALDEIISALRLPATPLTNRQVIVPALGAAAKHSDAAAEKVLTALRAILAAGGDPTLLRNAARVLVKVGVRADLPRLESAIAAMPQKWHHKEAERWRRGLKRRVASLAAGARAQRRVKALERRVERLQKRIETLQR